MTERPPLELSFERRVLRRADSRTWLLKKAAKKGIELTMMATLFSTFLGWHFFVSAGVLKWLF